MGGIAEAVMKMAFGNGIGFEYSKDITLEKIFGLSYAGFILELANGAEETGTLLGHTNDSGCISLNGESIALSKLLGIYENKLESVYSCNIKNAGKGAENFSYETTERKAPAIKVAKPRVLIPAFPGTNCEYDSAKAVRDAGAEPEIIVINNLSADGISRSVEKFADELRSSQMIFIPGGFSGGDEPDGSGKFITAFFRNAAIKEGVTDLLENRDGLMCGICNGFQALIKLGLVPYGKIIDTDENCPTLTFNTIARHQSRIVRTRISSNKSPWLALTQVGDIYSVPISHGEGRFLASGELIAKLAANGQIASMLILTATLQMIYTSTPTIPSALSRASHRPTAESSEKWDTAKESEKVFTKMSREIIIFVCLKRLLNILNDDKENGAWPIYPTLKLRSAANPSTSALSQSAPMLTKSTSSNTETTRRK